MAAMGFRLWGVSVRFTGARYSNSGTFRWEPPRVVSREGDAKLKEISPEKVKRNGGTTRRARASRTLRL